MGCFAEGDEARPDFRLLQNGAVSLFRRKDFFEEARASLRELGYVEFLITYRDMASFKVALSDALDWQGLFGYSPWSGNLDALNDGLGDFPFGPTACASFCIEDFDKLAVDEAEFALIMLDLLETNARYHLLYGRRLAVLIQTSDSGFEARGLGGRNAQWNAREWLWKDRGLPY